MDTAEIIALIKIVGGLLSGFYLEYSGIPMVQGGLISSEPTTVKLFGLQVTSIDLGIIIIALGVTLQIITIRYRIRSEKNSKDKNSSASLTRWMLTGLS